MARTWLGLRRHARALRRRLHGEVDVLRDDVRATGWWRALQRLGSPETIPRAFLLGFAVDQLRGMRLLRPAKALTAGVLGATKLGWLTRRWWWRERGHPPD
ncbi:MULTISPECIES: hypothetical protein [Thioalkalivibrio]|uniref:hypothetical protein n=1 Tax=Thioalkalivibrio TaxID=106633 RepID=UPI0003759CC7|nr:MULTISPECIES: hypothetical protein [Thioalkalivibrio]